MDRYVDLLSGAGWDEMEEFNPIGEQETPLVFNPIGEQATPPVEPRLDTPSGTKRLKNFTEKEDEALVQSWLAVGMDAAVGNNQRQQTYWARIAQEMDSVLGTSSGRSQSSLIHRWSVIQGLVSKFCGCYDTILRKNASGTTDDDKVAAALSLFKAIHKKPFYLIHCWVLLRDHPKWSFRITCKKQKTSSTQSPESSAAPSVSPFDGDGSVAGDGSELRKPEGCKAAKAKKKRGSEESGSSVARSVEAITNFNDAFMKQSQDRWGKIIGIEKEKLAGQREQREMDKRKQELEEKRQAKETRKMNMQIMAMNLDELIGPTRVFYEKLKEDVMKRWNQ